MVFTTSMCDILIREYTPLQTVAKNICSSEIGTDHTVPATRYRPLGTDHTNYRYIQQYQLYNCCTSVANLNLKFIRYRPRFDHKYDTIRPGTVITYNILVPQYIWIKTLSKYAICSYL